MKYEERERMVDRLLDQALSPQPVEPRPGLEERILAGLHAQPAPRPWWQWAWIPVTAAVIVAVGLYVTRRPQPVATPVARTAPAITPAVTPAVAPEPAPQPVGAQKTRLRPAARPRVVMAATPLPRQEVFPSPVPLTAEEQLLLALRSRHPAEVVDVAQAQQNEREKIQKYVETGEAPGPQPAPAREMR